MAKFVVNTMANVLYVHMVIAVLERVQTTVNNGKQLCKTILQSTISNAEEVE